MAARSSTRFRLRSLPRSLPPACGVSPGSDPGCRSRRGPGLAGGGHPRRHRAWPSTCSGSWRFGPPAPPSIRSSRSAPRRWSLVASIASPGTPCTWAWCFLLLAWAVYLSAVLPFAGIVVFVLYITRFQIQPEERVLTGIFGDELFDLRDARAGGGCDALSTRRCDASARDTIRRHRPAASARGAPRESTPDPREDPPDRPGLLAREDAVERHRDWACSPSWRAGPKPFDAVVGRLGLHPRSARDFLDTLVALGLPAARPATATPTRRRPICSSTGSKPSYVGGILEMANHRLYPFWGHLTEALRTGQPQNEVKTRRPGPVRDALRRSRRG